MNAYRRFEAWCRARLTPEQQRDADALDSFLRRHRVAAVAALLALWAFGALALQAALPDADVGFAWIVSAVILLGMLQVGIAAWFSPGKFASAPATLVKVALITLAGALVGGLFGRWVRHGSVEDFFTLESLTGGVLGRVLIAGIVIGLLFALVAVVLLLLRRRQLEERNRQLAQQAQAERQARQLVDAQLRLLQAQVEPHFLFNTLASIQELSETRAPEAAALTAALIRFLRGGLASLRNAETTLGAEFELAHAYLSVMQVRMGRRLSFRIDLPAVLADCRIPPAMVITLAENAIKHGIEPSPAGGEIALSAAQADDALLIEVADSGLGLDARLLRSNHPETRPAVQPGTHPEGGVGLANLRDRLQALFGDAAGFELAERSPQGTVARLRLPLDPSVP
jgi:signal transduction histidine kinase